MVVSEADDRAVLARVASGDRDALEVLYRRHAAWLTTRLQSRYADDDMVDMAIQDTFLAVWRSAKRYRGDGAVAAWLWGIALRRLIDQLRKRRPMPVPPASIMTDVTSFEAELLDDGTYGDLAPLLRSMHPDLRAVLIATAIDGLTTREAAKLLGIPQGTVKTRLSRARTHLQEALS